MSHRNQYDGVDAEERFWSKNEMRRVIVTGGRDFTNYDLMDKALHDFILQDDVIVQGGARGADLLAAQWAQRNGVQYVTFVARWTELGAFAGRERNTRMLAAGAQCVIAFPGGTGTAHMVEIARAAGVVVITVDDVRDQ
jgi:predicted Rossmann-fold nucleotide-binding protein